MGVEQERLKRMKEIRDWLLALDVCEFCSLRRALMQTEREMGDRDWQASSYICRMFDFRGESCFAKIERYWPELQEATLWARTAEMIVKGMTSGSANSPGPSRPTSSSAATTSTPAARKGTPSSTSSGRR